MSWSTPNACFWSRHSERTSLNSRPATGARLRFPHSSLTRALMEAHVGLEVMDIGALCRTYNLLAAEGRSIGAAVLIEPLAET